MFNTFLINLDKDTERLEFMDGQLRQRGISYERQSAILGKSYQATKEEYDEEIAIRKGGHALLPGELGCALSHAMVLRKIVDSNIQFALVLEDDVAMPDDFKKILEHEIVRQSKYEWDYLLFDYVKVGWPFLKQWVIGVFKNFVKTASYDPVRAVAGLFYAMIKSLYIVPLSIFEGIRDWYKHIKPGPVKFHRPIYFAGAYLVTQEGARKLLALTKPIVYTADQLPNKARMLKGLRLRGYAPAVVGQLKNKFGSSILDLSGNEL